MGRWKKIRCGMGWHKFKVQFKKYKVHKYYCQFCKKPRKSPLLKVIDGGNKFRDNNYKF